MKEKIDAENYKKINDFRRYALAPAVDEINKYADFKISYELTKTGRTYTGIMFRFSNKTLNQHYKAVKNIEERLNSLEEQISFT